MSHPEENATPFSSEIESKIMLESWEILDLLQSLVDKSLIVYEEGEDGQGRYRLPETVRQYADEKQARMADGALLSGRHSAFFLALTEEAQARLRTPEEKWWFDCLEAEYDNLRAAMEWAIQNDLETALKMSTWLGSFWMTRGFAKEGDKWLQKGLAAAGEMPQARADALNCQALMKLSLGSYEEGKELAHTSLVMLRGLEDKKGMAKALNTLGAILMEQGHYSEAQTCYEECLIVYRAIGHRMGESIVLANLGNAVYGQGEYELACTYYTDCLHARRELGDKRGIAAALDYLGRAVRERGDFQRACELHSESLAMRRELNDKQSIPRALNHLGVVKTYLGEREEARQLLEESMAYSQEVGDITDMAETLSHLGVLSQLAQDELGARTYWSQSLHILQAAGEQSGIAGLLEAFAGLANSQPQFYDAAQMMGAAAAIRNKISNPVLPSQRPYYEQTLAALRLALGDEPFQRAWEEGQRLPLDTAINLASLV